LSIGVTILQTRQSSIDQTTTTKTTAAATMKVLSISFVAAAIFVGQASSQPILRGQRGNHSTKQCNAINGEEQRLQENGESSLSMAYSIEAKGTKNTKKGKVTRRARRGRKRV